MLVASSVFILVIRILKRESRIMFSLLLLLLIFPSENVTVRDQREENRSLWEGSVF